MMNIAYVFCVSDGGEDAGGEGSEEAAGEENGEIYYLYTFLDSVSRHNDHKAENHLLKVHMNVS